MKHPWFEDIDWKALEAFKAKSPYVPKVDETNNFEFFDPEFTQEGHHTHSTPLSSIAFAHLCLEAINSLVPKNRMELVEEY